MKRASTRVGLHRVHVLAVLAVTLTACTHSAAGSGGGGPLRPASSAPEPVPQGTTSNASPAPVTMADATRCPVTLPSKAHPRGVRGQFFGWGSSYGNGDLWVGGLWPHGVLVAGRGFLDQYGRVGMKFGWWRSVSGTLHITGRRMDAPAPPPQASVPRGYGPTGFQSSGVTFPTEGCWEVTGTVGQTRLTFVTFVIKRENVG